MKIDLQKISYLFFGKNTELSTKWKEVENANNFDIE